MRAILVNYCHPDCPHVCATRAREFANALARRGHHIVLLSKALGPNDDQPGPQDLPLVLSCHDWSVPFRMAVVPRRAPLLEAARSGRLPAALRAPVILYQYGVRGGMFTDWRDASQPYWRPLAHAFRPDVVWGVFGNTDTWAIAQGIARAAECPWLRDIKDQWTCFMPAPLRWITARRFADAFSSTALSQANAEDAAPWFPGGACVVHSGFPAELLVTGGPACPKSDQGLDLTLVGAIYSASLLETVAEGIEKFLDTEPTVAVRLTYVGTDADQAVVPLRKLASRLALDIRGQLPFRDYWDVITGADINIYLRTPHNGWWHHKIVELLAANRPILCCPGEIPEAQALVDEVGGRFFNCPDEGAVLAALRAVKGTGDPSYRGSRPAPRLTQLTWDAGAERLAAFFEKTVAAHA